MHGPLAPPPHPTSLPTPQSSFDEAVAFVKTWKPAGVSNDDKLALYALFKQATVGDVNTPRPGMFDFEGKAKHDAWSAKKGMSKGEAEAAYVAELARQRGVYGG